MAELENARKDNIELSLPLNAAYLAAARLTASSVANRIGFDAEEIEDIKTAISEACTYIIRHAENREDGVFKVNFYIDNAADKSLKIVLTCDLHLKTDDNEPAMGLMMIKALMDDTVFDLVDGGVYISLTKTHKTNIFE